MVQMFNKYGIRTGTKLLFQEMENL